MAADVNIYGTINTMAGDGKAVKASQCYDETLGKFQSDINQENANDGLVSATVRQTFSGTQKAMARTNIGAMGEGDISLATENNVRAIVTNYNN